MYMWSDAVIISIMMPWQPLEGCYVHKVCSYVNWGHNLCIYVFGSLENYIVMHGTSLSPPPLPPQRKFKVPSQRPKTSKSEKRRVSSASFSHEHSTVLELEREVCIYTYHSWRLGTFRRKETCIYMEACGFSHNTALWYIPCMSLCTHTHTHMCTHAYINCSCTHHTLTYIIMFMCVG